eukprot:TRINITY_DN25229_c0_g1_i2.p1 TRINITY_DN25229_c0_g1~~TRINITY_DN25229_c0_g1_i2.p1  ORF type:complete len:682 (+),score=226.46 TRINITY_DN25229_c0_g1_i2:39-2084(+)
MLQLVCALAIASVRAPSYPIAVQDPYASLWSPYDHLNDGWLERWNGWKVKSSGLIRVDNVCYTWLGPTGVCRAATQTGVEVKATQTTYTFAVGAVSLNVTFRTPRVLTEVMKWELFALPLTYLEYTVVATDGGSHAVQVYFDMGADMTVNDLSQNATWSRVSEGHPYNYVKIGNAKQAWGSNCDKGACIDNPNWGWASLGFKAGADTSMGSVQSTMHASFSGSGKLPADSNVSLAVSQEPVIAVAYTMTAASTPSSQFMVLGYDSTGAMSYFGTLMYDHWYHLFGNYVTALNYAAENHDVIVQQCESFDAKLTKDFTAAGNEHYAEMGSLAYRQVAGSMVTVWNSVENVVWVFMKEISSDGDVSTVDVLYPSAPALMYYSPEVMRLLLVPVMEYATQESVKYGLDVKYNLTWAPHHLGVWPVCDQTPESQEQMPVEETGNILLMIAVVAQLQGNVTWLAPYWTQLDSWATYLTTVLPDPGNQLCTDDFEGPSPHNANLAVKGIVSLGAYAALLKQKGDTSGADKWNTIAEGLAVQWVGNATDPSKSHTKLQYDLNGTWSQKYNLFFQYVMGITTIPEDVLTQELAYYDDMMNAYGIPLDVRSSITKVDWSFWCASMGSQTQFLNTVEANYKWLQDTPQRVPWSDYIQTNSANRQGFQARPVIGGIWSKVLLNQAQARRASK